MVRASPKFVTVTAFCSYKIRYRTLTERSLQPLIETGRIVRQKAPRFVSRGSWMATYALPDGRVLEIYEQDGEKTGYLFLSLDTWLSYPNRMMMD